MTWLNDHREQELRTFRARFDYQQWEAFRTGNCWRCLAASPPRITARTHGRILCAPHTIQGRVTSGGDPRALVVPSPLTDMDFSEIE